jgi:hypothetical protein
MRENFMSGIDEGRQDKRGEACFLLYLDIVFAGDVAEELQQKLGVR